MLALLSIDYKFLAIPIAFILLRVWSFVVDILYLCFRKKPLSEILNVLGVSQICDTNQFIYL